MRTQVLAVLATLLVCFGIPASAQSVLFGQERAKHYANSLAPYVASPQEVVDRMLDLAELRPGETLYDLGSGDGRILVTAVQRYHVKAVGIEISDALVKTATDRIRMLGLENDARVIHGDMLQADLSPADVVTIYLATDSNAILRPVLEKFLKPGARVVSHDYVVPGWKPKVVDKDLPGGRSHVIYVYQIAAKKK
jgi:SAM-dependent methyltransferase